MMLKMNDKPSKEVNSYSQYKMVRMSDSDNKLIYGMRLDSVPYDDDDDDSELWNANHF